MSRTTSGAPSPIETGSSRLADIWEAAFRGGEGRDHEDYVAFGIDLWTKEDVEGRGEWGVLEFRCHPSIKDQYTASPPHKGVKRLNHIEGMTGDLRKEVSSATFAGACGGSSEFRLMVAS